MASLNNPTLRTWSWRGKKESISLATPPRVFAQTGSYYTYTLPVSVIANAAIPCYT